MLFMHFEEAKQATIKFATDCADWIREDCVTADETGVVQVSLSVPRTIWFEFVRMINGGFQVTCSAAGVMGICGTISVRAEEKGGPLLTSDCGLFSPNLTEFGSLRALREMHPDGPRYLLEVRDVLGRPAQRILIPSSSLDSYFDFVATFQAPTHLRETWFSPNHADGAQRRQMISQRIPWLRRVYEADMRAVVSLTIGDIASVLRQAIEQSVCLRTTVYNRAVIQGAIWTPEMTTKIPLAGDESTEVTRFFGDGTGFELIHGQDLSAWLWTGMCACCGKQKWALELGDADEQLCLAIRAVNEGQELEWRRFVRNCLEL